MKVNSAIDPVGISIITPVYNRSDCIGRCIESVVSQQYDNVEHWIVDDGSTDDTSAVIEEYARQYPSIRYHRFDANRGVNAARNYAIQHSSKAFVFLLDSDDYLAEGALASVSRTILTHPGYRHYLFAQDDRQFYYNQNALVREQTAVLTFADFLTGRVEGDFAHVVAGDLIRQFPFDEYLRIYEALTFFQLYKAGEKQFFTKQTIVRRERGRPDSVTSDYHLINKEVLHRQLAYLKALVSRFREDYLHLQAKSSLSAVINRIFILNIALGNYRDNKALYREARLSDVSIAARLRLLNALRVGLLLRSGIFIYSCLKHQKTILKRKK
jgi:glycosyltransferase involved in cell wall biosynthesis